MTDQFETRPEFPEFPSHNYEGWKEAAIELLKGASFEKTLQTPTPEGITLSPIYMKEDIDSFNHLTSMPGCPPFVRGRNIAGYLQKGWGVSQEIREIIPARFNEAAKDALQKGQTELNIPLTFEDENALFIETLTDFAEAMEGISLTNQPLYLQNGGEALNITTALLSLAKKQGVNTTDLTGCSGADPLRRLASEGEIDENAFTRMKINVEQLAITAPNMQSVEINVREWHDAGASAVEELGIALATSVEYIRILLENGQNIDELIPRIRLTFAMGGNFFMEIAKLRAARLLFAKITEAFGATKNASPHIHATAARWNKTLFDPYVNMLRATTEAFSAVIGGCDSLNVACFDEVSRPSTPLAQRVARNTHTILGDECNLNQVIDPAGGSYSVEWLTNQLAEESWKFFQELETAGGMTAALEAGIPQQRVEEVADKKIQSLGKRKAVLVGTNMFPNPGEVLLESEERELEAEFEARDAEIEAQLTTRDVEGINEIINRIDASDDDGLAPLLQEVFLKGLTLSEIEDVLSAEERISVDPIFVQRLAEDFEELRMSVDELDCSTIFQANIGPSRAYRARADWTSAFFQVGGFTVEGARDFDNVDDAIKAAKKMNAKFVVLTSSDKTYKDCVPAFARKFKTTTPDGWLLVAGAPGESEKTWREAGVDDFVHVRINNYEMLNSLLEKMEVKS